MADVRKEQERAELHKMIWNAATDLVHAGGVDAWDFKQYVLGTMFYRYISENIADYIDKGESAAGNANFNYSEMSDDLAEPARAVTMTAVSTGAISRMRVRASREPSMP